MYSVFTKRDAFVFSEIFSMKVAGGGGPVSMQRRFVVTEGWAGRMDELPVAADRDHYGTPFVPAEVAVLLLQSHVLETPAESSYCVQFAGRGYYCDSAQQALEYCRRRWPREMQLFYAALYQGAPLEVSPSRKKAFEENKKKLDPWIKKADAQRVQITEELMGGKP